MIGPDVQRAVFTALTTANVAGGRVYDRVPDRPVFPYVTIGDERVVDDGNTCDAAWMVLADVYAWSRPDAGSKGEVKTLGAAIAETVMAIGAVPGCRLVLIVFETMRTGRRPDGLTEFVALTFRFHIDPL